MSINITNISGVIQVSQNGGYPKSYFGVSGKFAVVSSTTLLITLGLDTFQIEYSDLTVNGQVPSTLSESISLLSGILQQSSSGGDSFWVASAADAIYTGKKVAIGINSGALFDVNNADGTNFFISNKNVSFKNDNTGGYGLNVEFDNSDQVTAIIGDKNGDVNGTAIVVDDRNSGKIIQLTATNGTTVNGGFSLGTISEYADNAAALAGGLVVGNFYRTGDILKIVH